MNDFIIENNILKAYLGNERVVVVPNGVRKVGGLKQRNETRKFVIGDPIGYKAFFCNETIEELYLPDSVKIFGFKCLEHCKHLKVLSFSNNLKEFECNALLGCDSLKKIIFRGTLFEFSLLSLGGHLDLDEVICTDGVMHFYQEYYIDVLNFPGTRAEWESFTDAEWLKKKAKQVICTDD